MKKTLLVVLLLFSFRILWAAEQTWYEAYDSALNDIKMKNWRLAEEKLKAALKLQPRQGRKIRAYGARFMNYIPEYYLGVVYFHQGNYQGALENFLRVQNQELINKGDEEYEELTRLSRQAMVKLSPAAPDPESQFAHLMDQANKAWSERNFDLAKKLATQAMTTGVDEQKAMDLLKKIDVEQTLRALKDSIAKSDEQQTQRLLARLELLDPQNPELVQYRELWSKRIAESAKQQQTAPEPKLPMAEVKQTEIPKAADLQVEQAKFLSLLEQAKRELRLKNFQKARQTASLAFALGIDNRKAELLLQEIDAAENLQSEETAAIVAFYSGEYQKAIRLLENLVSRKKESERLYFYLGCSQAALAFLDTGNRSQLLQKARLQFAQAKRLNKSLTHDTRFISPRILEVYKQSE